MEIIRKFTVIKETNKVTVSKSYARQKELKCKECRRHCLKQEKKPK